MPTRRYACHVLAVLFLTMLIVGCNNGGGSHTPVAPAFTSTPPTAAEEGMTYTYTVMATASDGSAVTFALTSGPQAATLEANTVMWTPNHAQSRMASSFTVTATTANGGTATQTWSVTPNGTVNITAVTTYWGPNGSTDEPPVWPPANLPNAPAAFIPQPDGSLLRLAGAANPDGSYSIPNVPAGYYWLQPQPTPVSLLVMNAFWTSASDFDAGRNVIGDRLTGISTQQTTTFDYGISGVVPGPTGEYITLRSNGENLFELPTILPLSGTTVNSIATSPSLVDWSKFTELYLLEYEFVTSGSFAGTALGPTATQTGVSLVDGGTNSVTATLNPSPTSSVQLSIQGSVWVNAMQGIGPGTATPSFSEYAVVAQPYLTNGFVVGSSTVPSFESFPLLESGAPHGGSGLPCAYLTLPPPLGLEPPVIVSDVDYGTVSYGDPFPTEWPRLFQYCQASTVSLPRPNSTVTDTFTIVNRQTTPLPNGPVSPLLTAVQNPTLNGNSLFTQQNLNTTSVSLSWGVPATGQPTAYQVTVLELVAPQQGGAMFYETVGTYGTAKKSMQVPPLAAGNSYVLLISAVMDANANIEKNPFRTKVPSAESTVISAPMVVAAGATAAVKR